MRGASPLVERHAGRREAEDDDRDDRRLLGREHAGQGRARGQQEARAPGLPPAGRRQHEGEREEQTSSISWMAYREKKTIPGETARSAAAASAPARPIQRPARRTSPSVARPKTAGTRRMETSPRPTSSPDSGRGVEERRAVVVGRVVGPRARAQELGREPAVDALVVVERGERAGPRGGGRRRSTKRRATAPRPATRARRRARARGAGGPGRRGERRRRAASAPGRRRVGGVASADAVAPASPGRPPTGSARARSRPAGSRARPSPPRVPAAAPAAHRGTR